jgi:hypothetical protein
MRVIGHVDTSFIRAGAVGEDGTDNEALQPTGFAAG